MAAIRNDTAACKKSCIFIFWDKC